MEQESKKLKYALYCRKSSEGEDAQVQSITAQKTEMLDFADRNGLEIAVILDESKSAHHPGRPIFNELVRLVKAGKVNAILVWHANRISRNPIDAGQIIYLLDQGLLKEIRTYSGAFRNTSNDKFFLGLEFGVSKKDSDDKSDGVKRGQRERARKGYPHGVSSIGYMNDKSDLKGNRKWLEDPARFELVREVLHLYLKGKYSVQQISSISNNELHLKTPLRVRQGGRPLSMSHIYSILKNPVYAGFFFYENKRYTLNDSLERMITEEQYWIIQGMLTNKGRPRPQKRPGLYNHFMKCGYCGCTTTPDHKFQLICSQCKHKFSYLNKSDCPKCGIDVAKMVTPTYLSYIYYHCTKKRDKECPGRSLEVKQLEAQVVKHVESEIMISKELSDWAIKYIGELGDEDLKLETVKKTQRLASEEGILKKLDNLLDLRLSRGTVATQDEEIFSRKEKKLNEELSLIRETNLKENNLSNADGIARVRREFSLMSEILDILKNGTIEDKKSVLYEFGSNLTLTGKKVSITNTKSIQKFVDALHKAKAINARFEPKNTLAGYDKTEVFASVRTTLLREQDSNLRQID